MKRIAFLTICLLTFGIRSNADDEIKAKVVNVLDGNTLEVKTGNDTYKIVLSGIDCPELQQPYGDKAKKYMERIALRKQVTVRLEGKDRKGNYLATVWVNQDTDVRVELLKEGLAWTVEKDAPAELEPYKSWAQKKEKGLWKQKDPVPPWTFRRQQSMLQPKSS